METAADSLRKKQEEERFVAELEAGIDAEPPSPSSARRRRARAKEHAASQDTVAQL